jgi:hypothetical protein
MSENKFTPTIKIRPLTAFEMQAITYHSLDSIPCEFSRASDRCHRHRHLCTEYDSALFRCTYCQKETWVDNGLNALISDPSLS